MTAGHSLSAGYWLLGGECLYLPQTWFVCGCVHLYSLTNLKVDPPMSKGTSGSRWGIRQAGVCASTPRRTSECGVQRDKCVCKFTSEYQAGPNSDWGPVGWVRGLGAGQRSCVGRGAILVLGRSTNMCVCLGTWRVLCVCAWTSDVSLPAGEEEDMAVCACVLCEPIHRLEEIPMVLTSYNRHRLPLSHLCKCSSMVN